MTFPTLLIGLGDFGASLGEANRSSFISDTSIHNSSLELLSLKEDLTLYSSDKPIVLGLKSDPQALWKYGKSNFDILQKKSSEIKKVVHSGIENLLDPSRYNVDVDATRLRVIVYCSLGDDISSVAIREILSHVLSSHFKSKIEVFIFAVDFDFLNESRERAYCCLSELDDFLNKDNVVKSFTIISKYSLNTAFPVTRKEDVTYLSNEFSEIVIKGKVDEYLTSKSIRQNRTTSNKRTLYNSFGKASINYSKDQLWGGFTNYEMNHYLSDLVDRINNSEIPVATIHNLVSFYITQNDIDKLYQRLSTDTNNISFYKDISSRISTSVSKEQPSSAHNFISLIQREDDNYFESEWREISSNIAENIPKTNADLQEKLNLEIISKINNQDNGIAFTKALLKELLGKVDDNADGVIIDAGVNINNLEEDLLNYFKFELYGNIPEDEREDLFKEIISLKSLQKLKARIRNLEEHIEGLKDSRSRLDDDIVVGKDNATLEFEDGFFTIDGKQVNIDGLIEADDAVFTNVYSSVRTLNELPEVIDLRQYMSSQIEFQGTIGSCVTNAIASALEYISRRSTGQNYRMSRLFLYYNARTYNMPDSTIVNDSGCNIHHALESASKYGVCKEEDWPYLIENVNTKPSEEAYYAANIRVEKFQSINPKLEDMLSCLSDGYPFIFGLKIFPSFDKSSGLIQVPTKEELANINKSGSHAMLCVGYNRKREYFVVRNSWGSSWGDKGYCYIPFDYLTDPQYVRSIATIRSVDEQLNAKIKQNISSADLNFFRNGDMPSFQLDMINIDLKKAEGKYNSETNLYAELQRKLNKQNQFFRNINNRSVVKDQVLDIYKSKEDSSKQQLRENESNIQKNMLSTQQLKAKERRFLLKFFLIPIALFLFLIIVAYFTETLPSLLLAPIKQVINDPVILLKPWKTWQFWVSSAYILYFLFKYIVNFLLVFKQLRDELRHLKLKDKFLRTEIIKKTESRWEMYFKYIVYSQLYEKVIKNIIKYTDNSLRDLEGFIAKIISFKDIISSKLKMENINEDSCFEKEIVLMDNDHMSNFYNNQQDNVTLSQEEVILPTNMLDYFNSFKREDHLFEKEVKEYFDTRKVKYMKKYTLQELINNDYFLVKTRLQEFEKYLSQYSNPLLDVDNTQLDEKYQLTSVVYNSNEACNPLIENLRNLLPNVVDVLPNEDKNELVVFQFINTFPGYKIKTKEVVPNKDLSDFFVYPNTSSLEPDNN